MASGYSACDLKAVEVIVWQRRIDQTVRPIERGLRGKAARQRTVEQPSDNVLTTARSASEPRGNGATASIKAVRA